MGFWALCLAAATIWLSVSPGLASIPERPGDREFIHDLAKVLHPVEAGQIEQIQQDLFGQTGVPIVVVTITWMSDYEPETRSVEAFAKNWFNTWGIGSQEKNDGILVIMSTGDRKARIELGAAWGHRFDMFCQQLMDRKMVPQFKQGKYGKGLLSAVSSLAELAAAGPGSEPPTAGITDRILDHPAMQFVRNNNPVAQKGGPGLVMLMILAGIGCIIAAIYIPQHRKPLLIAGVLLILIALIFWVLVFIAVLLGSGRGSGGSDGGGGGFSGGFSGGGGASGSW